MTVGQLKQAISNLPDDMQIADRYDSFYYHEFQFLYIAQIITNDSSDFEKGDEICIISSDPPPEDAERFGIKVLA